MEDGGNDGLTTTGGKEPTASDLQPPPVPPTSPAVVDQEDEVSELEGAEGPEDRQHFHQPPGQLPPMPPHVNMMLPPPPAFVEPPLAFYHEHPGCDHPNTHLGPPLPPPSLSLPLPASMVQAPPPEPLILNSTGDGTNGNGEARPPYHQQQQHAPINPPQGQGCRLGLIPPPADGFPFPGLRGFGVPPALFLRRQQAMLGANADNKRHTWTGEEDRRLKV